MTGHIIGSPVFCIMPGIKGGMVGHCHNQHTILLQDSFYLIQGTVEVVYMFQYMPHGYHIESIAWQGRKVIRMADGGCGEFCCPGSCTRIGFHALHLPTCGFHFHQKGSSAAAIIKQLSGLSMAVFGNEFSFGENSLLSDQLIRP